MTKETIKRDGNWIDEWGACKICDGEIPYGHSDSCDLYKLEQMIRQLKNELKYWITIIDANFETCADPRMKYAKSLVVTNNQAQNLNKLQNEKE